jgi:uncharacterized protein YjdB
VFAATELAMQHLARRFALAGVVGLGGAALGSCVSPTAADSIADDVASVAIDPPSPTVVVGAAIPLSAVVQDASGRPALGVSVVWSVKDANVASISQTGVVTGRAIGSTQVAASANGLSAVASVTVSRVPVGSVAIVPSSATVTVGQAAALVPMVKDANGLAVADRAIVWSSSDDRVATVSTAGVVRGIAAGHAVITATSEGKSATAAVTVQSAVSFVVVSPKLVLIRKTGTVQLSAVAYDANSNSVSGRPVTWSSDDPTIATVDATGLVSTKKPGLVQISAAIDGKSDSSLITVTK